MTSDTAIAEGDTDLGTLGTHESYMADIRRKHARKIRFWAYVNGARQVGLVAEESADDEP